MVNPNVPVDSSLSPELLSKLADLRKLLSEELIMEMQVANNFHVLCAAWKQLDTVLNLKEFKNSRDKSLLYCLASTSDCFQSPRHNCDSFVKMIVEQGMMSQVEQLGIPPEFLYETVRIGALRGLEASIAESNHGPVELIEDGTLLREAREEGRQLPKLIPDGFAWANEQLRDLYKKRENEAKIRQDIANETKEVKKELLIEQIAQNMGKKGFALKSEEVNLLEWEWVKGLRFWKAAFESRELLEAPAFTEFFTLNGDKEITPQLFEQFKKAYNDSIRKDGHLDLSKRNFRFSPLNILNPESGWFFICIKCLYPSITFNHFRESAYGNMDSWGIRNLTIST